jgi:hypothetical protein
MYTLNLDDYKNLPDTKTCYLDGRYFNKVFSRYPGLVAEPLEINIFKGNKYNVKMNGVKINSNYPGILRVIITTPTDRHSNLLILDYEGEKIFRFEPLGMDAPYYDEIDNIICDYMSQYMDNTVQSINTEINNDKNIHCGDKSGFCVAYVIKFAYDYLNGRNYDPSHILRFANKIQSIYPLNEGMIDEEYGFMGDGKGRNTLLGGLGGGVLGGVLGGPVGLVAGAVGGSVLGNVLTQDQSPNQSRNQSPNQSRNQSPNRDQSRKSRRY